MPDLFQGVEAFLVYELKTFCNHSTQLLHLELHFTGENRGAEEVVGCAEAAAPEVQGEGCLG